MARDPGRLGCAAESFLRGEPLTATASRVSRWLLIEQPGPWGREALRESRLEPRIAETLRSRSRRLGVRVVLIRRPDRGDTSEARAYLVRSATDSRWIERIDLPDPEVLMQVDLTSLDSREAPGHGVPGPSSVRLVCTNGRHDPCCADFGRPVVRVLRSSGVEELWESSHVGGDRFAANLVILPTGTYYGRVPPERAAAVIREHDEGLLDLELYRGRSCFQPLTQAADIFLRRELGERRIDGVEVVSTTKLGSDAAEVVLDHGDERFRVSVHRELGDHEHLTCSDHGATNPWRYLLDAMETVAA